LSIRPDPVARKYARALLEVARDQELISAVSESLERVISLLDGLPELEVALKHPRVGQEEKLQLLDQVARDALPVVRRLLELLLRKGRWGRLRAVVSEFERLRADLRGEVLAEVTVAHPVGRAEEEEIQRALSRLFARRVTIRTSVDPGMIGGLRVVLGDRIIDNTVVRRLQIMRRRLKERPLEVEVN